MKAGRWFSARIGKAVARPVAFLRKPYGRSPVPPASILATLGVDTITGDTTAMTPVLIEGQHFVVKPRG
jgi:hypothetical protein